MVLFLVILVVLVGLAIGATVRALAIDGYRPIPKRPPGGEPEVLPRYR